MLQDYLWRASLLISLHPPLYTPHGERLTPNESTLLRAQAAAPAEAHSSAGAVLGMESTGIEHMTFL